MDNFRQAVMKLTKNAYQELTESLQEGEKVEALVFGDWGWGGYKESEDPLPKEKRGVILTLEEAEPFMQS